MHRTALAWSSRVARLAAFGFAAWLPQAGAQGLTELYHAALHGNPTLKAREFDVERARAEADGAYSRLLPQVAAQASLSTNEYRDAAVGRQNYDGKRASLNARQSLYDAPAWRRVEGAQASVAQREHELALNRAALFGELLERYLQALAAEDQQAALAAETLAANRQVDRLRAMRERQMAKVTDLVEAQAYAQGLVTRAIDARNDAAEALARLTELCGIAVVRVPALTRTAFAPVDGAAQDWVVPALRDHPRLLALAQAVEAARRGVDASRAEHWPQLAATLSRVYTDQGFDNRRQPPYHATSLGLELRVPLYEGGRVGAAEREAAARVGAAEQQFDAARREIEREIVTLWASAQANHARIDSTAGEVRAYEQSVQAQERALELGVSRITDLLDARRRLLEARAGQSKARYDFVRDVVALKIRSGGFSAADVALWEGWFASGGR